MAIISAAIPNMIGGVSQQPAALRLTTQCETAINMLFSVVEGACKRPPTRHVAKLMNSVPAGGMFTHTINRDVSERYKLFIHNGGLRVFDINGVERSVSFPDGAGYLSAADPENAFRAVTVADHTFVVNATRIVAMSGASAPTRPFDALINVKSGNYGRTYAISINGAVYASYRTPFGENTIDTTKIDTRFIAQQLYNHLTGVNNDDTGHPAPYFPGGITASGWTVHLYENALYLASPGGDFTISAVDGFSGFAMTCNKGEVQRFSDLPNYGPHGFVIKVAGDPANEYDDYWVYLDKSANNATAGQGVWKETIQPGVQTSLDAGTMPHLLVRNGDGTFTFKRAVWGARAVGDAQSSPNPSFVGVAIKDAFFFRNRFGVIADENVIMSRAAGFFDFFRETVTTVLDSDPIDVSVSHVKVSILRYSTVAAESLVLFSDQTQFRLGAADLLTPKTAAIPAFAEYESSSTTRPVSSGSSLFFAQNTGRYSAIREFRAEDDGRGRVNLGANADSITSHVPLYLEGSVKKLVATQTVSTLLALMSNQPNRLYAYRFHWADRERLQSAWSYWDFGAPIIDADFIDSDLHVVVSRNDGVFLERMSLEAGRVDPGLTYTVHLDRRVNESQLVSRTYNANADTTTIVLPYSPSGGVAVAAGDGYGATILSHAGNTVVLSGNLSAGGIYAGITYIARWRYSRIYARPQGEERTPALVGRLTLAKLTVAFYRTGYMRAVVEPLGRSQTYEYVFSGRTIGHPQTLVGAPQVVEGHFAFPIRSRSDAVSIDLINDSYLPFHLQATEWEGQFYQRSRRV